MVTLSEKSRGVTLLGATGSIGLSTLDVIRRHPQRYHVVALAGKSQVQRMAQLCEEFKPAYVVMAEVEAASELRTLLAQNKLDNIQVLEGLSGLEQVAALPEVDTVVAAIVGAAGLAPTLSAARSGKRILLANKEALVMSGQLFMDTVRDHGATLLPVDSEHNAIFQCLPAGKSDDISRAGVKRILLTASGGPFRTVPLSNLERVTPEDACNHPTWDMGRKISVDSATMMNKGLEVIEACWLFNASPEQIQVVIHPQSVVHSMVQYEDGSVLAQLGNPDMRTPIANALAWPERIDAGVQNLDIFSIAHLDFEPPDLEKFTCLTLAMEAARTGGTASAVLNAANEEAVEAFLQEQIKFTDIATVVAQVMEKLPAVKADSLDTVLAADKNARIIADEIITSVRSL